MANIDLNLMVIFDTIMQEQSVTAAARRLAMTQPSVSNAVSRMRHLWNDPIFVKQGRGIRPTPFAQAMWREIGEPLHRIRQAGSPIRSDIRSLKRTLRIAATDWMTGIFWLPLRRRIEAEAPLINLHAVPYAVNGEPLLLNAEVDMVLDYYEGNSAKIESRWLFDNHFVCAMRPGHPLARQPLTLAAYTAAEHLLFSLSGEARGGADRLLQQLGTGRRVAMTVNNSHQLPGLLTQTDLITTIPLAIILDSVRRGQLIARPCPVDLAPGPISMAWHTRHQRDPALLWLREKILQVLDEELLPQLSAPDLQKFTAT